LGSGIYDGVWVGPDSPITNVRGIRSDVVTALKAIRIPVIRWPGGCFADEYFWRDGIGARSNRPIRKNNWWGSSPETNQFGTHEFMDFVDQIGSEAYVSINVGSSNPTEMREWIEYMTSADQDTLAQERRANGKDAPFKVPFIGIGNESWGCGGNMSPEYYANEYVRFAAFFHKGKDNPAVRIASGAGDFNTHWTDVVMKIAGKHLDAISLHYYTLPTGNWKTKGPAVGFGKNEWVKTFKNTLRMEDVLAQHIAVMDEHDPEKRVGLYVDEWGTWYDVEPNTNPGHLYQRNTIRDAVIAAANFNIFHRHVDRVRMTNIAQTINVLQAMILTRGREIVLTPTYYAYKMYVPFQDAVALPLELAVPTITANGESIPALNASAARGKDGIIYIGLASMSPDDPIEFDLALGGFKPSRVSAEVLTGSALDANNEFGRPEQVKPKILDSRLKGTNLRLQVPPRSVVVIAVHPL
jgi:alpha-N-arabinofuranosidase